MAPGQAGHGNAGWVGEETGQADGERVLTPTSIYAPGTLISPQDGDEGAGPVPPRDGYPAGDQPGYRTAPGYGTTPGYGTGPGRGDEPGYGAARGRDAAAGYGAAPGHGAGPGYGSGPEHGAGQAGRWDSGYAARPDHSAGPGGSSRPGYAAGPGSYPGPEAYRPGQAAQRGYAGPGYGHGANPGYGDYPRPDPGPAHGAAPYRAPGGREEHGGRPAANGYPGPSGYPGQDRSAGPGQHAAADWYASADGYDGADEYGGPVNGGGYAYVIRDEEPAQAPPDPRTPEQAPSPEPRPRQSEQNQPNQQTLASGQAGARQTADPAFAYGPDDPGYGPPGPEWYARREDTGQQAVAEELRPARGPFEPLADSHRTARGMADGTGGYPAASYPAASYEALGLTGTDDDGLGGRGGALDQIKDFYAAAEALGAEHFDEHFERLLERQGKLISDYFTEPAGRRPADPNGELGSGYPGSGAEGPRRLDGGRPSFGAGQRSPR